MLPTTECVCNCLYLKTLESIEYVKTETAEGWAVPAC
jgi:hypothetical protein